MSEVKLTTEQHEFMMGHHVNMTYNRFAANKDQEFIQNMINFGFVTAVETKHLSWSNGLWAGTKLTEKGEKYLSDNSVQD